ncbi:uncharacterized protein EI90DRAFT_3124014 [Cantharellus anzutake]|uniref:uncharacterized protein n=1 Tax=Cantharellus anzutake TaxID=1750568 RepID=UPI001908F50F|nr:uncharacterized protein EI90DRAFT_3124014 [Cantharellus anzutake]KAF8330796.1 hypothetical protein EI90DRAFT_3124014 [Cantharellus anzutake]
MDVQPARVPDLPQPSPQDFTHVSVDTLLQTFQPAGVIDSDTLPFPTSAFARSLQDVLHVHLPMILEQTRKVIEGVTNAYEPNVDPTWSAGSLLGQTFWDFDTLCDSFDLLKDVLVDTGIGALPLTVSKAPNVAPQVTYEYPPVDEVTMVKQVEDSFAKVMSTKEAAEVALNTLLHEPNLASRT